MAFRTILSVTGLDSGDGDLALAADLCERTGAHLSAVILWLAPPPIVGRFGVAVINAWLEARQASTRRLEERTEKVSSLLAGRGLSADVTGEYSEESWADETVGMRARHADLTLVGPELMAGGQLKDKVIEGALFMSGKPLLVVPEGSPATLAPKRVMVALDSGVEAYRAMREALDVLVAADEVRLVLVDPDEIDEGPEPGADAAAYLARHGISVGVDRLAGGGLSIADVLRRHADAMSAELLVMGAYGHSRLRERIFGGVTWSMLQEPPLPILMAR